MKHRDGPVEASFLAHAGKAIQRNFWQCRSFFWPEHIRTYWRIVREHRLTEADRGRKFVFFDFTTVQIDNLSGRYVFSLVRDFEALGFMPCYRRNFRFLATMRHKTFKRLLLQRPFRVCGSVDELPAGSLVAEITDRPSFPARPDQRQIGIRYDERWPQSDREVPLPFFVYPLLHEHWLAAPPPDLAAPRSWRALFLGNVRDRKYARNVLPEKFGKMSRHEIVDALASGLPANRIRRLESPADLQRNGEGQPCFLWGDTAACGVPTTEWLRVLDRADFFLACPGMAMPLCHSLVEALSRGTVPVLEHPEFLDPPLEPDVNCLAFNGREGLLKLFERIMQLNASEIARLRRGAYAYYEAHLAPGRFAGRVLALPHSPVHLLMNAYRTPRGRFRNE